ncbi:MAG: cytochrome c5 family protein, partial [Betaproteobacteria bacterium]
QFIVNMRSIKLDSTAMSSEAVAKRLKPAGDVAFAEAGSGATAGSRSGEDIYKSTCSACHAGGAAGAPKLGDKGDWAKRLSGGQKRLVASAIKGIGAMPPRGGGADLSDLEMERVVVYMANQAGAKFKEPAAPATQEKPAANQAPDKVAATAPAAASTEGKKVYDTTCAVCHGAGVAGAPKAGDKAAWAPRLKSGMNALYANALKGKGAMPPKGGNSALADAEVKAAVDYLAGLAK